ncbi:tetratricopeptide repeat protein [Leptothrix ochracea]|uniref:tetratricopeptide repeat protein n=1 Tax=Leptothrix ochracea TaxID=735331 RepID=UPI0034E1AFE5
MSELAPHARQYPPNFESVSQREELVGKLKLLIRLLNAASAQYPDDQGILFRKAFANSMGHNVDLPGCASEAIKSYELLLARTPDDKSANFYYGAFLSSTTNFRQSVPYLKKAISLGVEDAHYTLAFVYLKQNDPQSALPEFQEYLKVDPTNQTAKKMVNDIENGTLKIKITKSDLGTTGGSTESASSEPK